MWRFIPVIALAAEPVPQSEPSHEPAQEPAPEPAVEESAPPADAEMLVTATLKRRAAELALNEEIRELGYLPGVTIGGRTQYLPVQVWKPRVTVYEAGFVAVRGRRMTPMGPPTSPGQVGASGVWQSKRQAKGQEDRVRRELAAEVTDWQQAIRAQALLERQILVRERCLAPTCPRSWRRSTHSTASLSPLSPPNPASLRRLQHRRQQERMGDRHVSVLSHLRLLVGRWS